MSGGSFNYLFLCESNDVFMRCHGPDTDLARMRIALAEYPGADVALAEVDALIESIESTRRRIAISMARLSDVFRAIEWHHSGDGGSDDVAAALLEHRQRKEPP